MGVLLPAATHKPRPPHLPPPFGLITPSSPHWPPPEYVIDPETRKPKPIPGVPWYERIGKYIIGLLPWNVNDVSTLANKTQDTFHKMAVVVEQDIHDAYTTNLDYSHAIVQHANDIGRAAEHDIQGLARDIHALTRRIEAERQARMHADKAYYTKVRQDIAKARAYAIAHAVADSRAFIAKNVFPHIHSLQVWVNHADEWWTKRIDKWWTKTYKRVIRPIKTQNNNQSIQIGIIWATINGEIQPTVKLAASAKDWLRWFAKWKRIAIEAFAGLKAAEVVAWLAENFDSGNK